MNHDIFWEEMGNILPRPIKKVTKVLGHFAQNYVLTYDRKIDNYGDYKETMQVYPQIRNSFFN